MPILSERIVFPSLPIHEPPRCGPMHSRLFPFSVNGTSSFGYKHKGNFARTPRNMIQPLLKRTIPTIGKVNVTCENGPCHGVIHNLTCQSNFLNKYVTDCMIVTSFKRVKYARSIYTNLLDTSANIYTLNSCIDTTQHLTLSSRLFSYPVTIRYYLLHQYEDPFHVSYESHCHPHFTTNLPFLAPGAWHCRVGLDCFQDVKLSLRKWYN